MYYYIKGEFIKKGENFAVIEAGGVGYKIYTSNNTLGQLPEAGKTVKLYTYFYVREEAEDLYGFFHEEEQAMFLMLISVSGVGPKAALAILSAATPGEVASAVIRKEVKVFKKAQGVGQKMAERIILELKNKIKNADMLPEFADDAVNDESDEAIGALMALGYSEQEAKAAVGLAGDGSNVEETIRLALKNLMK